MLPSSADVPVLTGERNSARDKDGRYFFPLRALESPVPGP
ncbi:hypothetical protein B4135_1315 [Caldibacillus debilis]|uniref:Uncharacterized protein n=1 Tax=Caldibacillus debilis TaxID=301148 RepID=A0A150MD51_9BACI|nr:hypothetical protein B4135_1315 [Caldibacillus debilis]